MQDEALSCAGLSESPAVSVSHEVANVRCQSIRR